LNKLQFAVDNIFVPKRGPSRIKLQPGKRATPHRKRAQRTSTTGGVERKEKKKIGVPRRKVSEGWGRGRKYRENLVPVSQKEVWGGNDGPKSGEAREKKFQEKRVGDRE